MSDFNSVSVLREILECFKDTPPPYPPKTLAECMVDSCPGYLLPDNAREFRVGVQHILEMKVPGLKQCSLSKGIKQPHMT